MDLKNKRALVFGAGGQVGSRVAATLARHGAKVFLSGWRLASVQRVADGIRRSGHVAEAAMVDARNAEAIDTYVARVAASEGQIDIVFNAIGAPMERGEDLVAPSVDVPVDHFTQYLTHTVVSQFLTARAAARHMLARRSGVVIFLGATPSTGLAPFVAGATAAHAAIEGLTRCLATEWSPSGVRVVCIRASGMQETPRIQMVRSAMARMVGAPEETFEQAILEKSLLRRSLTVEETAELVAFLASEVASPLTGAILNASCGEVLDR
jgi:3-oxoacyl-[acyl-carrier protein] reductase